MKLTEGDERNSREYVNNVLLHKVQNSPPQIQSTLNLVSIPWLKEAFVGVPVELTYLVSTFLQNMK